MATKTPVLTEKAPKPLPGIYSQAIIANGVVYCSGAVAMDAETGKLVDGDVKAHTVCPSPITLIINLPTACEILANGWELAPMHQKPNARPRSGWQLNRQGCQSERVLR